MYGLNLDASDSWLELSCETNIAIRTCIFVLPFSFFFLDVKVKTFAGPCYRLKPLLFERFLSDRFKHVLIRWLVHEHELLISLSASDPCDLIGTLFTWILIKMTLLLDSLVSFIFVIHFRNNILIICSI